MVNMERCRWISPSLAQNKRYIVVNIPSFTLTFFKEEKPALISRVVVGKSMNQTAVFSGQMSQIVFSPYWNVPPSILRKEIFPAIDKNPNYLAKNDMEWVARPRDLAIMVLEDDPNWTPAKIDEAMNRGVEKTYNLKSKIPVYIGYFTAWVDREGLIHFYDDIYGHDEKLAKLLFTD